MSRKFPFGFLKHGAIGLLCAFLFAPMARAVIFYATADTSFNTTEPTGMLANTGWQWVGFWGSFQATPIDAHHFLAAKHVGGNVGDTFLFHGEKFTTLSSHPDPSSDLCIWEVREPFTTWAPLYRSNNEVGRALMVFGRGVTRGDEVRTTESVDGAPAGTLAGWTWGPIDGKLRWGQSIVAGTHPHPGLGEQLIAVFAKNVSPNACALGLCDSSAPFFQNDGGGWKLAGLASTVENGYRTTHTGPSLNAAIFDKRGLFVGGKGPVTGSLPVPGVFFGTRISVRTAWIDTVLAQPLTPTITLGKLEQTYDGKPHPIAIQTNPGELPALVTYDGSTSPPSDAGAYAVVVTISDSGYNGKATGTLKILRVGQSISFEPLPPVRSGVAPFKLNAHASSGLPITYASDNFQVATISDSTVTIAGPGTATITAFQYGDANIASATPVSQALMVEPPK